MDYGCGEATAAERVAEASGHLTLVEAAPNVRAALGARYAGNPRISVRTPERSGRAAGALVRSDRAAFGGAVFERARARPLAGDVPHAAQAGRPARSSAISCRRIWRPPPRRWSLLRCGAGNGFFWAAVFGLIRIFVSDYLRLKKTVGLSHYTAAAMLEKLKAAGYAASRAPRNIGHNQWRMTFLARPA